MRKIKWINLICTIGSIYILIMFIIFPEKYNFFIKNPLERGSGSTSSRLFYFILYKVDELIGKTGFLTLWSIFSLWFLYGFFNENMPAFKNRYQDYKETGDWRALFGCKKNK